VLDLYEVTEMNKQRIGRGIKVGNLYFVTGYPHSELKDWSVENQIRAVLESVKKSLEDAGSSLENVVKTTIYLVNLDDREKYLNPIWEEYFSEASRPVRCTIQVWLAPPAMVEMEFIAYIPEK
jgi:2-iminobutanoate/2-iminopropanoate deaminase